MTNQDPREVLEIGSEAGDDEIRAAYLRKVKEFPPDRSPREFERVRDAYDQLRDPRRRMRSLLMVDPKKTLVDLLEGQKFGRRFTGPEAWLTLTRGTKT